MGCDWGQLVWMVLGLRVVVGEGVWVGMNGVAAVEIVHWVVEGVTASFWSWVVGIIIGVVGSGFCGSGRVGDVVWCGGDCWAVGVV